MTCQDNALIKKVFCANQTVKVDWVIGRHGAHLPGGLSKETLRTLVKAKASDTARRELIA